MSDNGRYEDDELIPYEAGTDEDDNYDSDEDIRKSRGYDNNEVGVGTSFLIFGIVALIMIAIFILNAFHILPWWGTLLSSVLVLIVIMVLYIRVKNK